MREAKHPATQSGRIVELDSLRGLAAIGVVIYHYGTHLGAQPWHFALGGVYHSGLLLVDFFFILSGFVLARTYWAEARRRHLGANVWERIARLYPLHFATLLAAAAGQWILTRKLGQPAFNGYFNDGYHFVLNLLLLQYVGLQKGASFDGPSWSISTEFVVNLVFFAVICLPRRLAAAIALVLILVCSSGVAHLVRLPLDSSLTRTFCAFFVGALLQFAFGQRVDRGRARARGWPDLVLLAMLAIELAFISRTGQARAGIFGPLGGKNAIFSLVILLAPISRWVGPLLRLPSLVFLGEISYSIYLIHFLLELSLQISARVLGVSWPYRHGWFLLGFLAVTIACAAVTYRWLEVPGKRWMRSISPFPCVTKLPARPPSSSAVGRPGR